MPIYEYECQECGERFEYFHWFGGDKNLVKCPKCSAEKPKRIKSVPAESYRGNSCAPKEGGG